MKDSRILGQTALSMSSSKYLRTDGGSIVRDPLVILEPPFLVGARTGRVKPAQLVQTCVRQKIN